MVNHHQPHPPPEPSLFTQRTKSFITNAAATALRCQYQPINPSKYYRRNRTLPHHAVSRLDQQSDLRKKHLPLYRTAEGVAVGAFFSLALTPPFDACNCNKNKNDPLPPPSRETQPTSHGNPSPFFANKLITKTKKELGR